MASFCNPFQTFVNQSKSLKDRLKSFSLPPLPLPALIIIWQDDFLYVQFCGTGELLTVCAVINQNSCMAFVVMYIHVQCDLDSR